jgi:hypothetical protein
MSQFWSQQRGLRCLAGKRLLGVRKVLKCCNVGTAKWQTAVTLRAQVC